MTNVGRFGKLNQPATGLKPLRACYRYFLRSSIVEWMAFAIAVIRFIADAAIRSQDSSKSILHTSFHELTHCWAFRLSAKLFRKEFHAKSRNSTVHEEGFQIIHGGSGLDQGGVGFVRINQPSAGVETAKGGRYLRSSSITQMNFRIALISRASTGRVILSFSVDFVISKSSISAPPFLSWPLVPWGLSLFGETLPACSQKAKLNHSKRRLSNNTVPVLMEVCDVQR